MLFSREANELWAEIQGESQWGFDEQKILPGLTEAKNSETLLVQCGASVADGGPTLNQHSVNISSHAGQMKRQTARLTLLVEIERLYPWCRNANLDLNLFLVSTNLIHLIGYVHPSACDAGLKLAQGQIFKCCGKQLEMNANYPQD